LPRFERLAVTGGFADLLARELRDAFADRLQDGLRHRLCEDGSIRVPEEGEAVTAEANGQGVLDDAVDASARPTVAVSRGLVVQTVGNIAY